MKVFLCESIHPKALALLESRAEVTGDWSRLGEVDAIINRNLKLPRQVLEGAKNLRVIAVHGTGSDGMDLDWCRANGVTVLYVPYQNSDSVAELNVAMTLALLRKLSQADRMMKAGEVTQSAPAPLFGRELGGKTVGLIGTGDIAGRTARIFREGFRCNVIAYSPHLTDEKAERMGVEPCACVEEILTRADVIIPCVHLTPDTENMIGGAELAMCKPTAVLVNASRGGVVDENALFRALKEGQLAGAACDVWLQEPPDREDPLVHLPNLLALPHLGASTDEALERVGVRMVEEIFTVLDGGRAEYAYCQP